MAETVRCRVTGNRLIWRDDRGLHEAAQDEEVDVPVGVYRQEWRKLRPVPKSPPAVKAVKSESMDVDEVASTAKIPDGPLPHATTQLHRGAAVVRATDADDEDRPKRKRSRSRKKAVPGEGESA